MGMTTEQPWADAALTAKVDEKFDYVQGLIRDLEDALKNDTPQDRAWLRTVCQQGDPCLPTLLEILVNPKYTGFVGLCCVTLRASQIILRIAAQFCAGRACDHNLGTALLFHLAGKPLAQRVFVEAHRLARSSEPNVACNALLLLGELGPGALPASRAWLLLKVVSELPDRTDDFVEVPLRFHAWGGDHRPALLSEIVEHPGGQLLCEVLLQVVNRADPGRRLRAVKVLAGCLALPNSEWLLYTNDARVLVEMLLRELPNSASDEHAFLCYAECLRALALRCEGARAHRLDDARRTLGVLAADGDLAAGVRAASAEVLAALEQGETAMQQ